MLSRSPGTTSGPVRSGEIGCSVDRDPAAGCVTRRGLARRVADAEQHRADPELPEAPNPPRQQAYSRVEETFVNAALGVEEVAMATFASGVRCMDFVEAVYRRAQSG